MPYIYGKIYPEIELTGLLNHRFRVLIDMRGEREKLISFIFELCTLRAYLNAVEDSPAHLELFVTLPPELEPYASLELTHVTLEKEIENDNDRILSMGEAINADLIVTENEEFKEFFNRTKRGAHILVEGYDRSKKSVEVFVRGHEVPWSFSNPMWNIPWTVFYTMSDEFGRKANEIYETKFRRVGLDDQTVEIVRSLLLNRVANILYTRDKLLFYVQQRRYAKRMGWKRQGFEFEASYYLSHYYLLLWGGVDQLSRILNDALGLGVTRFSAISVVRDAFVDRIITVDEDLGSLYRDEEFLKWIEQLRRSRHHTAHQGSIILSPIVEKPETEPSDQELEKEAQATSTWAMMKRTLPQEMFKWYQSSLKESIRISKYKVLVDDAMVLQDGEQKFVFRPLANIEWDFNNFELITIKTLESLYKLLENRQSN